MIKRAILILFMVSSLTVLSQAQQPSPSPPKPQPPPVKKESFLDWLLRFAGITVTSNRQKGETIKDVGTIWVVDLITSESNPLKYGNNFRWPIFVGCEGGILALKQNDVFRLDLNGKPERKVASIPDIVKLVGMSLDNPDQVLIVIKDKTGQERLGTLSLTSGLVSIPELENKPVPNVPNLTEEDLALAIATSTERENGNLKVYVDAVKANDKSWTDVFLLIKKSGPVTEPTNLSNCNGAKCGQPSLSIEGRYVLFVKT